VYELFSTLSKEVFHPRPFASLRRGGRYDASKLNSLLVDVLGNVTLDALQVPVLLTSSAVDTHSAKTFSTSGDAGITVVDAIMASTAAPTYFPPRRVVGDKRGFYDGGLWANDPIDAAIACLQRDYAANTEDIRVLSIGTGKVASGTSLADVEHFRTLSVKTVRSIWDMTASLQASASAMLAERRLAPGAIVRVNPTLSTWVPLDDAAGALKILPGIADQEFEQAGQSASRILEPCTTGRRDTAVPEIAIRGIQAAGITRFIPARKYYAEFRAGAESISSYISQARREIIMVSVNLATGVEMEKIRRTFKNLLTREDDAPEITVSLLNPDKDYLMRTLCEHLEKNPDELADSIRQSLQSLAVLRSELLPEQQARLHVRVHNTLPAASAILLDPQTSKGLIQLETNSYKSAAIDSFGFEVAVGSGFFNTLRTAYRQLIADGEPRGESHD